jgi:hypothetical protein
VSASEKTNAWFEEGVDRSDDDEEGFFTIDEDDEED